MELYRYQEWVSNIGEHIRLWYIDLSSTFPVN